MINLKSLFFGVAIEILICFFSICYSHAVLAQKIKSTPALIGGTGVKITGTVVLPPPCTVNNDHTFFVEFGNVRTDVVNGANYERDVPVSIFCDGAVKGQLQLQLQGESAPDGSATLTTSVPGLGIKIKRDGTDFDLNSWVNVSNLDSFKLTATPVVLSDSKLNAGEFNATATLVLKQD